MNGTDFSEKWWFFGKTWIGGGSPKPPTGGRSASPRPPAQGFSGWLNFINSTSAKNGRASEKPDWE